MNNRITYNKDDDINIIEDEFMNKDINGKSFSTKVIIFIIT